jgi:hypothetical protein
MRLSTGDCGTSAGIVERLPHNRNIGGKITPFPPVHWSDGDSIHVSSIRRKNKQHVSTRNRYMSGVLNRCYTKLSNAIAYEATPSIVIPAQPDISSNPSCHSSRQSV